MNPETIHRRRWAILSVLVLALLVVILDSTILNVALKTIQQDLGASQSQLEWAVNSFTLVFAGLMFTFGVLGDRLGRRRLLIVGLLLFGASSALSAWSSSPGMLIATRALMGVGAAMVQPQTLSILTNVFAGPERAKALGIWSGFAGLAVAIGPVTGGLLLEHFWWGSIFLVNVPIVIVGAILVAVLVPESRDPNPRKLDPLGVSLSIVGVTALVYGIIQGGNTNDWGSLRVLGPIAAGLVLTGLFVLVQRRSSHPSLDVTLFKKPAFAAASGAITMTFFALSGSIFYTTFYLQAVRGYEPLKAGLLVTPVALGLLVAGTNSSRLARRFGTKVTVVGGMTVAALSLGAYHFVGQHTSLIVVELISLLLGLGMGNVMAPATESVMSTIPREKAGAGGAVNNTVRMLGSAFGVAVIGSILSASYRSAFGDRVNALPAGSHHEAGESIGGTLNAIANAAESVRHGQLPPSFLGQVSGLIDSARSSFISAMHTTSLWSMGILLVSAAVVAIYLPNRRVVAAAPARDTVEEAIEELPLEAEVVGVG